MAEQSISVDIPVGLDGLYGSKNPAQLPATSLVSANNITYVDGTLKKEGGASKYTPTALTGAPVILAGTDWWPDTATQRSVIITSAGTILKDSGLGTYPVTLASGISISAPFGSFVAGGKEAATNNRKLFIFTGSNSVQVLSGDAATTAVIAMPPADWSGANQPVGGVIHISRLWAYGNLNDPHRMYYSAATNHEAPTSTIPVYPGVGERILAAFSMRGFLVVFKFPHGIFVIDTRDVAEANWRVDKLSDEIGIAGIGAAVLAEKSIIFFDAGGNLQTLEQVSTDTFQIINIGNVSFIKSLINSTFDLGNLDKVKGVFFPRDREIHFGMPHSGSSINTRRFVIDLNTDTPRFRVSDRDIPISLWSRKIASVLSLAMGDNVGFVWNLGTDIRSKDGAGYEGSFETAPTDLAFADPAIGAKRKNGRFLEMVYEPTGNFTVAVSLLWDGQLETTYNFTTAGAGMGFILGGGILGIGTLGSASVLSHIRKRITGSGKRVSLRVSNSGPDENFSISKFVLYFNPADERLNV